MRRTSLVGLATTVACLIASSSALAWGGASIDSVSCPEIHFTAPVENGPWTVGAVEGVAKNAGQFASLPVLYDKQVSGSPYPQVTGGFYLADNATHVVTVAIGNAANIADGFKYKTVQMSWCANLAGTPGPPGPAGPPGLNGKDSNSANSTTTIIIHDAPKVCTSKRSYAFRVRKTYMGRRIVAVKATEPGIKVTVRKSHGRFVVSWSTKGRTYTPGGIFRSVTVNATLAGKKHVRLQWDYRPCMASDGTLNDPSAAGQGTGGGA